MKTARTPKPLEAVVQKHCMARFEKLGIRVWRRNVATMIGEYKGKTRAVRSGAKGQSDVWGIIDGGRHLEFETKRLGEKPKYHQIMWLRETNEVTGASFWADDPLVAEAIARALVFGGRVVYHQGECLYPNPVKGGKGKILGPSYEFDVEVPDYND